MIKDLSTKLKELRMSHNLSQANVAKKLGKSNDKPSIVLDVDELTPEQIQALQTLIKTMKHE